jgi:hypothetical protein
MTTNLSTGLARVSDDIQPTNMAELRAFAGAAASTGFYGAKSPEQALLLAMTGKDLGMTYTMALRAFHVVQGKPVLSADGMVAAVLSSGKAKFFRTVEKTTDRVTVETQRNGDPTPTSYTYTMADAKAAGLTGKDNWKSHPAAMLAARAKSALARDVYPDVLLGMYDPDEIEGPIQSGAVLTPAAPAPEPVRVDAQPLFAAIEAAADADALADVSTQIKAATPSLPDTVVKALRAAYGTRKRDLTPKPAVTVEEPAEREPGSDGLAWASGSHRRAWRSRSGVSTRFATTCRCRRTRPAQRLRLAKTRTRRSRRTSVTARSPTTRRRRSCCGGTCRG